MSQEGIIKIVEEDNIAVVSFLVPSINGGKDIDQTANHLRQYLHESQPKAVIVDFVGVKFFSSQVLGLLVDTWKRLSNYSAPLYICGINPQLSRVFRITNLDKLFIFCQNKTEALKNLADG